MSKIMLTSLSHAKMMAHTHTYTYTTGDCDIDTARTEYRGQLV